MLFRSGMPAESHYFPHEGGFADPGRAKDDRTGFVKRRKNGRACGVPRVIRPRLSGPAAGWNPDRNLEGNQLWG